MITRLLKSESLRSAFAFGAGGVGYAAGNILLARVLSTEAFGVVTLALALNQFALAFGPFGLEVVATRHRPRVGSSFALLVLGLAVGTAVMVAAAAWFYYHLSLPVVGLVFMMVVGTATNRVGVALFQGEHRLQTALLLLQVHNFLLLIAAMWAVAASLANDIFILGVVTAGYLLSAVFGWWLARRSVNRGRMEIDRSAAFREGVAVMGVGVAVQLLMQFERLAIPKVGSLEMLSTYAVLAAVVGSPFRMLQTGTGFSLLARLRSATTAAAARSVLLREAGTSVVVAVVASVAIVLAVPLIFDVLLAGKYAISAGLIAASLIVGVAKLWEGFSTTIVSAYGSTQKLATISVYAWICLAIAALGAVVGSRFGLVGILYGVGSAWILLAAGGTWLAVLSFRARFAANAGLPAVDRPTHS